MIIGHNTSQAMGKGVLDTFIPHPGVIPGPGGSKNGCFGGKKSAKMTRCHGCHVRGNIQPGNGIMGQNTPQAMRIDDPGGIPVSGVSKNDYFCVKKQQKWQDVILREKKLPCNWIMGHNTSQAMGIDAWDTFIPHPFCSSAGVLICEVHFQWTVLKILAVKYIRFLLRNIFLFKMLITFEPKVAQRSVASQNDHKSKACLHEV